MYDLNDAELPRGTDLIPDGTFAKVSMTIRPGGLEGQDEADRGLLRAAKTPGSDVRMLDCEFTVAAGPHSRRKFWQMFTVAGGKVDEHGVSIGGKISKGTFRAMIDSALGLDPHDMGETARAKRVLNGLVDLSDITFAAKIRVEPANDPRYGDSNRLDRVVLPGEPEYRRIMDGEAVPARPSGARTPRPAAPAAAAPAWAPADAATPAPAAPHAWERTATGVPAQAAAQPAPAATGPAWLAG
jgi:hypothetical protein